MIHSLTTILRSPAVLGTLPYAAGGLAVGVLAGRFVFDKLCLCPKQHVIREMVKNVFLRTPNAAFWATCIAWKFTSVAWLPAFVMGSAIFLTARLCMFVAHVQIRKQYSREPVGAEKTAIDNAEMGAMGIGALGGWQLGVLAVQQLGFTPIALPVIVGVGIATLIPAVISWKAIEWVGQIALPQIFRKGPVPSVKEKQD